MESIKTGLLLMRNTIFTVVGIIAVPIVYIGILFLLIHFKETERISAKLLFALIILFTIICIVSLFFLCQELKFLT